MAMQSDAFARPSTPPCAPLIMILCAQAAETQAQQGADSVSELWPDAAHAHGDGCAHCHAPHPSRLLLNHAAPW